MKQLLILVLLCTVCWLCGMFFGAHLANYSDHLITQTELQHELVSRGYDIEVDGVVGDETRIAWDLAVCQEYYERIGDKIKAQP